MNACESECQCVYFLGKFACHKVVHFYSFGIRSLGTLAKKKDEEVGDIV